MPVSIKGCCSLCAYSDELIACYCCCSVILYFHWGIIKKKGMITMKFMNKRNRSRQIQENKQATETRLRSYAFMAKEVLLMQLSTVKTGQTKKQRKDRMNSAKMLLR